MTAMAQAGNGPPFTVATMTTESVRPFGYRLLGRSEHVLFGVLLVLGAISARDSTAFLLLVGGVLAVAAWYGLGILLAARSRGRNSSRRAAAATPLTCAAYAQPWASIWRRIKSRRRSSRLRASPSLFSA